MRQFIINGQKIKNGLIIIDGKDFRYLRQVLRVKLGDMISVRLESGELEQATVARVDEKARVVVLQICAGAGFGSGLGAGTSGARGAGAAGGVSGAEAGTITRGVQAGELDSVGSNAPEFWLFQFITKPQKFELIVRQATECGVRKIIPVKGEFSEKSSIMALEGGGAKRERLERIIREARQQSGSPVNTEVTEPMTLEAAIELWNADASEVGKGEKQAFVLYERTERTVDLHETIAQAGKENIKKVCVACGCEGGISPSEIEILCEKGLFHPIHFAVNILRAETAALYGIAAVQSAIL